LPVAIERAVACIEHLETLGDYRFRHSCVETMRWATPAWTSGAEMTAILRALDVSDGSGDVYALRSGA
jgi:hypothetical protein